MPRQDSRFQQSYRRHLLAEQRREVLKTLRENVDPGTTLGEVADAAEALGWGEPFGDMSLSELADALLQGKVYETSDLDLDEEGDEEAPAEPGPPSELAAREPSKPAISFDFDEDEDEDEGAAAPLEHEGEDEGDELVAEAEAEAEEEEEEEEEEESPQLGFPLEEPVLPRKKIAKKISKKLTKKASKKTPLVVQTSKKVSKKTPLVVQTSKKATKATAKKATKATAKKAAKKAAKKKSRR